MVLRGARHHRRSCNSMRTARMHSRSGRPVSSQVSPGEQLKGHTSSRTSARWPLEAPALCASAKSLQGYINILTCRGHECSRCTAACNPASDVSRYNGLASRTCQRAIVGQLIARQLFQPLVEACRQTVVIWARGGRCRCVRQAHAASLADARVKHADGLLINGALCCLCTLTYAPDTQPFNLPGVLLHTTITCRSPGTPTVEEHAPTCYCIPLPCYRVTAQPPRARRARSPALECKRIKCLSEVLSKSSNHSDSLWECLSACTGKERLFRHPAAPIPSA